MSIQVFRYAVEFRVRREIVLEGRVTQSMQQPNTTEEHQTRVVQRRCTSLPSLDACFRLKSRRLPLHRPADFPTELSYAAARPLRPSRLLRPQKQVVFAFSRAEESRMFLEKKT